MLVQHPYEDPTIAQLTGTPEIWKEKCGGVPPRDGDMVEVDGVKFRLIRKLLTQETWRAEGRLR